MNSEIASCASLQVYWKTLVAILYAVSFESDSLNLTASFIHPYKFWSCPQCTSEVLMFSLSGLSSDIGQART